MTEDKIFTQWALLTVEPSFMNDKISGIPTQDPYLIKNYEKSVL